MLDIRERLPNDRLHFYERTIELQEIVFFTATREFFPTRLPDNLSASEITGSVNQECVY